MNMMKQIPLVLLAIVLTAPIAGAQDTTAGTGAPAPIVVYQSKFPITLDNREYDLLNIVFEFPKGAGFPRHYHGGNTLATVLSGEMTLLKDGSEQVVKTGGFWTESPGEIHAVTNKGESAQVSVSMLLPKGEEATTFVK